MTHIVVGAVIARNDGAFVVRLQDKKRRWIEWHDGWEWGRISPSSLAPFIYHQPSKTGKIAKRNASTYRASIVSHNPPFSWFTTITVGVKRDSGYYDDMEIVTRKGCNCILHMQSSDAQLDAIGSVWVTK